MMAEKSPRGATVVRGASPGPLVIRVDGRGKRVYYAIRERHGCDGNGRVYAVARLGAAFAYTSRTLPDLSCECPAFYTRGRCIHTGLLIALERENRV